GAPTNKLVDKLVTPVYRRNDPAKKKRWRCVGVGCTNAGLNRAQRRILRHAVDCPKLSMELRERARASRAADAPSTKVASVSESSPQVESGAARGEKQKKPENSLTRLVEKSAKTSRAERHAQVNLDILLLFCVAGIPMTIANLPIFKKTLQDLDNNYHPPNATALSEVMVVAEQQAVRDRQIQRLQQEDDITISVDGGTSRGREAFWTVHGSTQGEVFLMECREATDVSHTAHWIKDMVLSVVDPIGRSRISGVVSDSTGNTRLFRRLFVEAVPTCIRMADITHHSSNTVRNIALNKFFVLPVSTVRATITYFHKSHEAIAGLKSAREALQISRGLESIGKTRFGTLVHSSRSVQDNFGAIRKLVDEELLEFPLLRFVVLLTPMVKLIACVESDEISPEFVYLIWHASIKAVVDILDDRRMSFPTSVKEEIFGVLSHRHSQFFGPGDLGSKVYLTAAYFNPSLLKSDLFSDTATSGKNKATFAGIHHPNLWTDVFQFLFETGAAEVTHGHRDVFTRWKGHAKDFGGRLRSEFLAYAQGHWPFNLPHNLDQPTREWWLSLCGHSNAHILPHIATKIYSLRVNSMADERTVSTFTWLTPPLRSQ
ncbi:ribonuclease H-like domain-containing protein, partial [Mycena pura]